MGALGRSFQLVRVCLHVLSLDKELMVFPLLSGIAALIVGASFFGVAFGIGAFDRAAGGLGAAQPLDLVVFFLFYFVNYLVIIFFNSALVYAAHHRLAGGDPTIGTGLSGAWRHIGAILAWAAVSATVGMVLRALGNRDRGFISQIVAAVLGAAWTLATFFVVPLIVVEGRGMVGSMKESLALFRRTWGEQVVGNFGLGLAAFIVTLAAVGAFAVLFMLLSPLGPAFGGLVVVLGVAAVIVVSLAFAALDGIYKAALYLYASTGQAPELLPAEVVREGFARRGDRLGSQ
jgi:hypothetical protein